MPLHKLKVEDIGQPRRPQTIAAWQDMTSHELDDMQNRPPNIAVKDGTGKACKCKCLQTKACKIALAVFIVLAAIATIVIVALLVTGYYDERRYVFHVRNVSIDHSDIKYLTIDGNTTGPAIHVKTGQWLSVNVENEIEVLEDKNASLGLSIHWHGLNMRGNNVFDGVVGLTQCPIEERKSFEYRWKVDEQPGTYWYHTHDRKPFPNDDSKHLNQTNFIHGPLIIHPSDSKLIKSSLDPPRYEYQWENQIILFYSNQVLNGETEKTHTINVEEGQEYTFRIINGAGSNPHSYYFSIGTPPINLTVIATDAYPVEPNTTCNVINIAIAERYDVKVKIDFTENVWIRAVALNLDDNPPTIDDSKSVFAILKVGENEQPPPKPDKHPILPKSTDILNCYSDVEVIGGDCVPVTELVPTVKRNHIPAVAYHTYDIRYNSDVDVDGFQISIDSGKFKKNTIPLRSILEKTSKEDQEKIRNKTNILSLPAEKSVTIIIRSQTNFSFHPMHMHGHHFEVLEIVGGDKENNPDCKLLDLNTAFSEPIDKLMKREKQGVLKDTVILPACGAVAIRINSDNPGVWFFHCHIDKHMYKGLAAVIDENNFMFHQTSFPLDYPSCSKLY